MILAIASAAEPSLRLHHAVRLPVLVNGPIAGKIGMNCGIGAFSAVKMANAVIGRA